MGYLHQRKRDAEQQLAVFNYELSNEVVNRKLELQKEISRLLENDKYDGILNIEDYCIAVETEGYDRMGETYYYDMRDIVMVISSDGEVYVQDADANEYFLDDIREITFNEIYEAVVELTENN